MYLALLISILVVGFLCERYLKKKSLQAIFMYLFYVLPAVIALFLCDANGLVIKRHSIPGHSGRKATILPESWWDIMIAGIWVMLAVLCFLLVAAIVKSSLRIFLPPIIVSIGIYIFTLIAIEEYAHLIYPIAT